MFDLFHEEVNQEKMNELFQNRYGVESNDWSLRELLKVAGELVERRGPYCLIAKIFDKIPNINPAQHDEPYPAGIVSNPQGRPRDAKKCWTEEEWVEWMTRDSTKKKDESKLKGQWARQQWVSHYRNWLDPRI